MYPELLSELFYCMHTMTYHPIIKGGEKICV